MWVFARITDVKWTFSPVNTGSNPVLTTKKIENMEHMYYWVSTFLQITMIVILGGIYENSKKK